MRYYRCSHLKGAEQLRNRLNGEEFKIIDSNLHQPRRYI